MFSMVFKVCRWNKRLHSGIPSAVHTLQSVNEVNRGFFFIFEVPYNEQLKTVNNKHANQWSTPDNFVCPSIRLKKGSLIIRKSNLNLQPGAKKYFIACNPQSFQPSWQSALHNCCVTQVSVGKVQSLVQRSFLSVHVPFNSIKFSSKIRSNQFCTVVTKQAEWVHLVESSR